MEAGGSPHHAHAATMLRRRKGSEVPAPEPTGLGGKLPIGEQCPEPTVGCATGGDPVKQAVETDPKETGGKRIAPVIVCLAAECGQGGPPEGVEGFGIRSEPEVKISEAFEGHTLREGPPIGRGRRTKTAGTGTKAGTGAEIPGGTPHLSDHSTDNFLPDVGRKKEPLPAHPGGEPPTMRPGLKFFHRHNISKNE